MKQLTLVLIGAGLVLAFNDARAQASEGTLQQVDDARQRRQWSQAAGLAAGASAPALYPAESGDVGPQSVLKVKPRRTIFEATAAAQYFYTDNMFLTERDKQGADVLVSTIQFALAPTPYDLGGGAFAPRLGYQHQWFDFGRLSGKRVQVFNFQDGSLRAQPLNVFDFNAQTLFADGSWSRDHWTLAAGFDFRRLMDSSDYDEFYKEYVPRWGVQRLFPLNDRMAFTIGYAGDYRFAAARTVTFTSISPPATLHIKSDMGDRTDQILFASYTQALGGRMVLQPYYQFKFTHFTDSAFGRRNDCLNSFGVALYWTVCANCEVRTFADYNMRNSDNSAVAEYQQFDGGVGVNVNFRF